MSQFTAELAGDTTYSTLCLRLSPKALDAMVYNPIADNSLLLESFSIDDNDRRKSLEEIVYNNPLLLNEFAKRRIIVETKYFTIIPREISDDDTRRKLLDMAQPDAGSACEMIVDDLPAPGATFITAIPVKELNFLRRTFDNAPISLNLATLTRYFAAQVPKGSTVRAYINLRDDSADIIILGAEKLYLANRFAYTGPDDIAYYLIAATKTLSIDNPDILICGLRSKREAVLNRLRTFFPSVMPMIFPSAMYRAGHNAINAPFDLTIIPLCE